MDYQAFFGRNSEVVARELLGKRLTRTTRTGELSGTITETAAYEGGDMTDSRKGMLYSPGTLFLMPFRGYKLLNIATDRTGFPSCVEIRKLLIPGRAVKGPGTISRFLNLEELDGIPLGIEARIDDNSDLQNFDISELEGKSQNCLGILLLNYRS